MHKRIKIMALGLTALLLSQGCVERENDPLLVNANNLNLALQNSVDNSIIPAVEDFSAQAQSLSTLSTDFCADPQDISALQTQWINLNNSWFRLAAFNFGPLNADAISPLYPYIDSLRLNGTHYLATVRTEISNNLASSSTLNESYFAAKSFQRVGLLSLEALLFETADSGHSQQSSDILAEYINNPRKCQILTGISALLSSQSQQLSSGWQTQFNAGTQSYRSLFLANNLQDGSSAISTLINAAQQYLEHLKARNVAAVSGSLAGSGFAALDNAIDSISQLLEGTANTQVSFLQFIAVAGNETYVTNIRSNLARAKQACADQDITALNAALALLDGNFKREVPNGLNVELGLNFTDGD